MRIHFTVSDLARTRLGSRPSPLATATFSAYSLARPAAGPDPAMDLWRRTVRAAWRRPEPPMFSELAASDPSHPVPRFLRPHHGLPSLDEELARLRATPRAALRADLAYVARHRAMPGWAGGFVDGDDGTADGFAASVRAYHRVALAPYWRTMVSGLAADLAVRARQWRDGGIERVFAGLGDPFRWRPPYLEILGVGGPDYALRGRGLVLAPAAFARYLPCDPDDDQPTLFYPVPTRPRRAPAPGRAPGRVPGHAPGRAHPGCEGGTDAWFEDPLATLLGHSRAAVLETAAAHDGLSTGELARRAGLSSPSASEHAKVLRGGGLLTTVRSGRTSRHTVTALGAELLLRAASPETPVAHPSSTSARTTINAGGTRAGSPGARVAPM